MSHVHIAPINIDQVLQAGTISTAARTTFKLWAMVFVGIFTMTIGLLWGPREIVWATFYVNFVWWMGLALGMTMTAVIFQIVRAKWSPPIRRLAEANVSFLPVAFMAFLVTYFGKEHLFHWSTKPMPGREWWMQPDFVYARFTVLFGLLFFMMTRYVNMSLRGDVGLAQERSKTPAFWQQPVHLFLTHGWRGAEREILPLQRKMSINAPIIVLAYALIVSLFSFEMIMGMDPTWFSNLFGAFIFVSQIYIGWAGLALLAIHFAREKPELGKIVHSQQLWDLGKLNLAFCMMWGYMFWSQFLTQWYGNLPEETQWLILRTREYPWKGLAWIAFAMSFIIPFILLLSRDLKKTPVSYACVAMCLMTGVWLDRYMIIMPQVSPHDIPLDGIGGFYALGIFVGFCGAYLLRIRNFLSKFPFVPISHPLSHGSDEW